MNKYLVPMYRHINGNEENHLVLIEADTKYQALLIALSIYECNDAPTNYHPNETWTVDMNYNEYQECTSPESIFTYMNRYDKMILSDSESFDSVQSESVLSGSVLSESAQSTINKEDTFVDIYDYMYWGDYNARIKELASKALPEKWSFEDKDDYSILKNYLNYTFNKLLSEEKVIETDSYCVFNTGLFTKYYVPIYAYGEVYKNPSENASKWFFKGFKDKYELGALDILETFPERADYFSDPSRLVFNWHLDVNINYRHILDDLNTSKRLPDSIKNSETPLETLKGVIDTAVQRVIANYKLAVPHYYCNKIQLMIRLYFGKSNTPHVALVLDKMKGNYYQAATCLDMKMAYMDARLIAKPESNWLSADSIKE